VYVGFGAGGVYDAYARLLARTMGKYVPGNPSILPKNMRRQPAAGKHSL
jgi:tripartite-type tricarboxylate transporter receptor subunit TctC